MPGKATSAIRIQRDFSIMGAPDLCDRPRRRPRDGDGLLLNRVETPGLIRRGRGLEPASRGVGDGG
jgi:hypothetical protein